MVVEGEDDKHAIIELMGHHTPWPDDKTKAPVYLQASGDPDKILAPGFISAKLRESGTTTLGVVFDADEKFNSRWGDIRQICGEDFSDVPTALPNSGLILQNADGYRLGVWIMPNNQGPGMLETLLLALLGSSDAPTYPYAQAVVKDARTKGAPYRDAHIPKAEVHSWLAWQDPPGESLGRAITRKILNPHSPSAEPFIAWFLELYRLPRSSTAPSVIQ